MDKASESNSRETHDFMNVDSFSQLPFIRPPPLKEKPIRLFGIEFGTPEPTTADESESAEDSNGKDNTTTGNSESNRRFECHYCCRNFPTSQALGGHQNAHKRERQHAKRAHLHISEAQVYSLVNYRSFTSAPPPTLTTPMPPTNYPTPAASSARFYGSPYSHHHHQPINGSPLALWRIPTLQTNPTFNRDRSLHPLPLFAGEDMNMRASSLQLGGSVSPLQNRYVHDSKPSIQDHVSLDLHL